MIGLDTNILVRYITQDDPAQSLKANEIIERHLTVAKPGFISVVAMVEVAWVLDRTFGFSSQEIATAIKLILGIEVFIIENEQEVFRAMLVLNEGRASFADALIAELGAKAGCTHTLTFDNKAARLSGFKLA